MTFKDLSNILKKYREQQKQQEYHQTQTLIPEEVRAKELLGRLMVRCNKAYIARKQKWFREHQGKTVFEPLLEEIKRDMKLDEWFFYALNRICMEPHQRYYEVLAVGGTVEEAQEERDNGTIDILMDYEDYPDFDKVLNVWTHGK